MSPNEEKHDRSEQKLAGKVPKAFVEWAENQNAVDMRYLYGDYPYDCALAAWRAAIKAAVKVAKDSPYHRDGANDNCGRLVVDAIAAEIEKLKGGE